MIDRTNPTSPYGTVRTVARDDRPDQPEAIGADGLARLPAMNDRTNPRPPARTV
jgi:hypothetical protein